ncbi:MAG: hypothetical protein J6T57_04535 [Alphaproteobacteria bacterium]|nr:hypothetical protein [Alphaproteobacteria bacterium]
MSDISMHYEVPPYPYKLCQKALGAVFDSVEFYNKRLARNLRDSYFGNLKTMLKYADENGIDELSYILDIRGMLINSRVAHEYR